LPGPGAAIELWGRLVQFTLVLVAVLAFLFLGASFFLSFMVLVSMVIASLLMTVLFSTMLFVGLHLLFAVPGMVQMRRTPMRAIQESVLLTRGDFLNVTILILLILVISQGLNVVWLLPDPGRWTMLVGIVGHAFVNTALTVALFVFYQERLSFLKLLQQIYAAKEARVNSLISD
jgi:hypothetical protein